MARGRTVSAPEPGFVAKQRLRVAVGLVGIPNVPTVDSVIAAVSLPDVRESAAASLGITPAQLGSVSAAVDGKNTSVVVVSSRRPTEGRQHDSVAEAVSDAARARVLAQVDPNIEYQRLTLAEQQRRIESLQKRLDDVSKRSSNRPLSRPPSVRASNRRSRTSRTQIFTAQDRADLAEAATRADGPVRLPRRWMCAVAPGSSGGYLLSSVLRGMLVGLLAGLAIG